MMRALPLLALGAGAVQYAEITTAFLDASNLGAVTKCGHDHQDDFSAFLAAFSHSLAADKHRRPPTLSQAEVAGVASLMLYCDIKPEGKVASEYATGVKASRSADVPRAYFELSRNHQRVVNCFAEHRVAPDEAFLYLDVAVGGNKDPASLSFAQKRKLWKVMFICGLQSSNDNDSGDSYFTLTGDVVRATQAANTAGGADAEDADTDKAASADPDSQMAFQSVHTSAYGDGEAEEDVEFYLDLPLEASLYCPLDLSVLKKARAPMRLVRYVPDSKRHGAGRIVQQVDTFIPESALPLVAEKCLFASSANRVAARNVSDGKSPFALKARESFLEDAQTVDIFTFGCDPRRRPRNKWKSDNIDDYNDDSSSEDDFHPTYSGNWDLTFMHDLDSKLSPDVTLVNVPVPVEHVMHECFGLRQPQAFLGAEDDDDAKNKAKNETTVEERQLLQAEETPSRLQTCLQLKMLTDEADPRTDDVAIQRHLLDWCILRLQLAWPPRLESPWTPVPLGALNEGNLEGVEGCVTSKLVTPNVFKLYSNAYARYQQNKLVFQPSVEENLALGRVPASCLPALNKALTTEMVLWVNPGAQARVRACLGQGVIAQSEAKLALDFLKELLASQGAVADELPRPLLQKIRGVSARCHVKEFAPL